MNVNLHISTNTNIASQSNAQGGEIVFLGQKPDQRKQMLYHDQKNANYNHKFGRRDTSNEVSLIGFGRDYEPKDSPGLKDIFKVSKHSTGMYPKRQSTKDHLLQLELQR